MTLVQEPPQDNGLSAAMALVQSIYDQVTLNDSPPVNDEVARFLQQQQLSMQKLQSSKNQKRTSGNYKPSNKQNDVLVDFNRQRHVLSLPPDAFSTPSTSPTVATSSEDDNFIENMRDIKRLSIDHSPHIHSPGTDCPTTVSSHSNVVPIEISTPVQQRIASTDALQRVDKMRSFVRKAEYSLGHVSLAALCVRSLNSMEMPFKGDHLTAQDMRKRRLSCTDTSTERNEEEITHGYISNTPQSRNVMDTEREMVVAELDFLFKSSFLTEENPQESPLNHAPKEAAKMEWHSPNTKSINSDKAPDNYDFSSPLSDDSTIHVIAKVDEIPVFQPALDAAKIAEEGITPNLKGTGRKASAHSRGSLPPLSPTLVQQSDANQKYPRLQMYGSEYARHLSKLTHFSPTPSAKVSAPRRLKNAQESIRGTPPRFPLDTTSEHGHHTMPVTSIKYNSSKPDSTSSFESSDISLMNCSNIEEADEDVLTGAITDIIVTHGSDPPPKGFYRISKTSNGLDLDMIKKRGTGTVPSLGHGKKNSSVWINVKKEANWDKAAQRPCVTALAVIFPDRNEFVPPGFSVVRRYKVSNNSTDRDKTENDTNGLGSNIPANLNFGSSGERVFLCYRRSREGNPITGLIPLFPSNNETVPEGYTVIEKTPRNYVADINSKAGPSVFLSIRQRLANLETLRPLPLILSVGCSNCDDGHDDSLHPYRKSTLKAYYCTGGTVVSSDVGRYHIMDRSTHMMLSSSSVRSRLNVIEASRLRRSSSSATSTTNMSFKPETSVRDSEEDNKKSNENEIPIETTTTKVTVDVDLTMTSNSDSFSDLDHEALPFMLSPSSTDILTCNQSFSFIQTPAFISDRSGQERLLSACYDALDFIPSIECSQVSNNDKNERFIRNQLQARISVLTPVLTACYSLHGGSALMAVEGLTSLLKNTNFFLPDVENDGDRMVDKPLTLLELSVQVVCDVGNSSSREAYLSSCVEFVVAAIKYSNGNLHNRTLGYVIRFYFFVFYFGASIPNLSSWPQVTPKEDGEETKDIVLLSEEEIIHTSGSSSYFPGGAPQSCAVALKELISLFLGRLPHLQFMPCTEDEVESMKSSEVKKTAVDPMANFTADLVEKADFTQLALHQILKSGGSELFWFDMISTCGAGLFASDRSRQPTVYSYFVSLFSILATLVKAMSGPIRRIGDSSLFVPRDVAGKFLSFELLQHLLENLHRSATSNFDFAQDRSSKITRKVGMDRTKLNGKPFTTIVYAVRRLVIPTLLENTKCGMQDVRVFRRMMKIVSELWCHSFYREHVKVEIGVLIEHFFLKFLRLGPQLLPPKRLFQLPSSSTLNEISSSLMPQQVAILTEVKLWFSHEPRQILELFLNFDDLDSTAAQNNFRALPSTNWCITEQLCSSICTLSEQCTEIVSEQIRVTRVDLACIESSAGAKTNAVTLTQEDWREMTSVREGARYLQEKCFEAIGQIVRSIMLCAAASSGSNYDLLATLRERRMKISQRDESRSKKKLVIPLVVGVNLVSSDDCMEEDEGCEDGINIQSISTMGNIVGSSQLKRDPPTATQPGSPSRIARPFSPVPSPSRSSTNENGIFEYWRSSIARERKKYLNSSPANDKAKVATQDQLSTGAASVRRASGTFHPPMIHLGGPNMEQAEPRSYFDSTLYDADKMLSVDENNEQKSSNQKVNEILKTAFEIMTSKSLKKSLDFLFACNFLPHSPQDIASFLRLFRSKIDPEVLGDYLGEGGRDGADIEHFKLIRFHYTRAISFVDMNVEQALRHFLTDCGFRLPGEAQKIDRIMTTFSQCYWEDNAGDFVRCPFQDEDHVFLTAFAIIMLNTDLHKASSFLVSNDSRSSNKVRPRKKMTKTEFLNNLRGIDNYLDPARDYLSNIYDSIEAHPIEMHEPQKQNQTGRSLLSLRYGGEVQLNFDCFSSDLSIVIADLYKNAKLAQEWLRGLAVHEHSYQTLKNYRKKLNTKRNSIPAQLVTKAFAAVWHHFHSVINSVLDSAHLNPKGLENCLDVLKYSLCSSICLNSMVERNAFAVQLVRVKCFRENRGLDDNEPPCQEKEDNWAQDFLDYKNDPWFQRIIGIDDTDVDSKVSALDEVDDMFYKLHSSMKVDTKLKKEMFQVVHNIRNGQILLNDPTRYFIKQSELAKKSNRSGRYSKYTFFLFSDLLVYAHMSSSGDFKIHEELPLHLMKIVDVSSTTKNIRSFQIIHPRKSFLVTASSSEERSEWVQSINAAINREVIRKARIEGARQAAAFDR